MKGVACSASGGPQHDYTGHLVGGKLPFYSNYITLCGRSSDFLFQLYGVLARLWTSVVKANFWFFVYVDISRLMLLTNLLLMRFHCSNGGYVYNLDSLCRQAITSITTRGLFSGKIFFLNSYSFWASCQLFFILLIHPPKNFQQSKILFFWYLFLFLIL